MTRYRVTLSGLTILAVAVSAAFDAQAQSKQSARARLLNSGGNVLSYCDGYSLTASSDGSLDVTCTSGTTPTPTPTPTPSPTPTPTPTPTPSPTGGTCTNLAGATITIPANIVNQPLYMGGTNNYALDSSHYTNPAPGTPFNGNTGATTPENTIQVFKLPTTWPAGAPVNVASAYFAPWLINASGVNFEVAFSNCPGDFSYYKTATAANTDFGIPLQVCGVAAGDTLVLNWGPVGSFTTCRIPPGTGDWYLNWRVVPGTCPTNLGHTCGQTFYTSGS